MRRFNLGILAHVDAGKTTTTEQALYLSGRIRRLGRVDDGTAFTDWMDVERARGISVRAAAVAVPWQDAVINLIDTPGHADFAAEVERALLALDGAILMVSAADGVQAYTELLWHALRLRRLPTLIYVNKVDRLGVDLTAILEEIRGVLGDGAVPVQSAIGEGPDFRGVWGAFDPDGPDSLRQRLFERLADEDDALLERFVAGEMPSPAVLEPVLRAAVARGAVQPIVYGASLRGIGVRELLDAVVTWLPSARGDADGPPAGVVFKVERRPPLGRAAFVRLFTGRLSTRDRVANATQGVMEKVTQIHKVMGAVEVDAGEVSAGDVAAVYGLSQTRIGDVLGEADLAPRPVPLADPLLSVKVTAENDPDLTRLADALAELDDEDPALAFEWRADVRECQVKVMGIVQLEILAALLAERFGLQVRFGPPTVIYRETPARAGEGFVSYTMPKPCWAILRFWIEPGPRGSGLVYRSTARPDRLLLSYQREVERRVPEALQQGLLGWQVTDLAVTLVDGEHHVWHTHPLDFVIATPMGILDGLRNTGTTVLEPVLGFRVSAPDEFHGRILSDLAELRAAVEAPKASRGHFTVEGEIPLATSLDYPVRLNRLTGGRGALMTRFRGYQEAPPDVRPSRPRQGPDPLDRAKYILTMRQALK